jgi:hypothetical protein
MIKLYEGGIFCETKEEIKDLIEVSSKHFVVNNLGKIETLLDVR